MAIQLGRTGVDYLTNKSGVSVVYGDVVVVDLLNSGAFTVTGSSGYTITQPGVCLEKNGIANNQPGTIAFSGPVGQINLNASASLGDFVKCHSVAKQGTPHAAPRVSGDFAEVKGTGTTPAALLFGNTYVSASGNVATDAIFDAKGDLPVGTGADTAAKLTVGANGTRPEAASGETTGIKWSFPPGYEFDYVERTTNLSVTATTEATADIFITGSAVNYDGSTPVIVEFYAFGVKPSNTAGNDITLVLYDGSSSIGKLAYRADNVTNASYSPVFAVRRITPSNAVHTYSIRAFVSLSTGLILAGAGGNGNNVPAYIRIIKAN